MPTNVYDPPALAPGTLRVTPLGGLGEIGRNMTTFEYEGKLLIVDCGVLFPEEHQPGVDLILPDFEPIKNRLDDIVGVVLTHGHEDHIGAVPYLLKLKSDIPLIGSGLTLALIEAKLKEHRIKAYTLTVTEGQHERVGPFDLEFIAVNHSIPDALAVAIRTPAGLVLATGDFKMDQLPLDGRLTDLRAFARLGEQGVDLFLVDSTNADVPGFTALERSIGPVLDQVIGKAPRRVIVASFASHVHRVQQVLDAAAAHGRRVALLGRSMVRNMTIADELGYLNVPEGILIDYKKARDLPDDKIVYMSTGSQGEPMAVLSRMANNDHEIEPGPGDTVILASSLIPGNENAVYRVIDGLTKLGANVVHKGNAKVHVSGHAAAGELLYCYNILQAEERAAGARRVPAPDRQREARAGHRHRAGAHDHRRERHGHRPARRRRLGRRPARSRIRLRRRLDGRRDHRCRPQGSPHPRRGGLHLGHRRGGCRRRAGSSRARRSTPEGSRRTTRCSRASSRRSPRRSPTPRSRGCATTTPCSQIVRRTIGRWVNTSLRRKPMIIPLVIEA